MKNRYYLLGTVVGLVAVLAVALYILGVRDLLGFLSAWRVSLAILAGYVAALLAGAMADRLLLRKGFVITVVTLVGVFFAGVFFGCLANFLLNSSLTGPLSEIYGDFWDWFVKPAYFLAYVGAPCALVIATSHYLANWLIARWLASRNKNQACSL